MSLDTPKEPDPICLALFNDCMRAYMLACDGATTKPPSSDQVTDGGQSAAAPKSALAEEMDFWEREWHRRKTDRQRLELIARMQAAAIRLKFAPDNSTHRGTLEWKRSIAFDERRVHVVASVKGVSVRTVYRLRSELNATRPRRRLFSEGQARRSTPKGRTP